MPLQLVIVAGDVVTAQQPIQLVEGCVLTIGRSLGNSIVVRDISVARRQCDIEIRKGTARLLDYGFTRGERFGRCVTVNGHPVRSVENFWLQVPEEGTEGTTQNHPDDLSALMQKQYEKLTWCELQCGDEIRVGSALLNLVAQEP
jgi:pSer/pThr/pTyr-binding forkhead associated (FHA) protein